MNTETHTPEQLAAYALNLLDANEAAQVEAHLVTCATCQQELQAYQEVTGVLTLALPTIAPPTDLKAQLMQEIGETTTAKQTAVPTPKPQPRAKFNWRTWFQKRPLWQPALVLVLIVLLISNFQLRQRLNEAQTPANFGTVTLSGTEVSTGATGIIIISADGQHGTLVVQDLPQLPESEAYQLWLIKDGQRTSGGLFNVDEDGYRSLWVGAPEPLGSYQNFGVTIEPAAGSPSPTGDKVLGN